MTESRTTRHLASNRARRVVQKRSQLAAQGDRTELIGLLWMRAREGHVLAIRTLLDLERADDTPSEEETFIDDLAARHRPAELAKPWRA